jgi:hypothetical protein
MAHLELHRIGGGGSGEESYELAFYMMPRSTPTWIAGSSGARSGYLFITGDELPYPVRFAPPGRHPGRREARPGHPIEEAIAAAAETYHVFFLVPDAEAPPPVRSALARAAGRQCHLHGSAGRRLRGGGIGIVGLTEKRRSQPEALAGVMSGNGMSKERVSAMLRVLRRVCRPARSAHAVRRVHTWHGSRGNPAMASQWWKRLFG